MRVLFIGDVCGDSGITAVEKCVRELSESEQIDLCIANGENSADGFGITWKSYKNLMKAGVNAFTLGNHLWAKKDILQLLESQENIVVPANLPASDPGPRYLILKTKSGEQMALVSVVGRVFSNMSLNCPLTALDKLVPIIKKHTSNIIIDVHAETTSEKSVLAWNYTGIVSAVVGTHTHVQTADERILPEGTAFISDVGMCGAWDSVIGVKKELAMARFRSSQPNRFEPANGRLLFNACIIDIASDGRATKIKRINNIL